MDLYTSFRAVSDHSRPPFDPEIIGALNFGYREVIRSVSAVRSELFSTFRSNWSIPANTYEIDVSVLDPPLMRPIRLLVGNQSGSNRAIIFRYRALHHQEYEAAEISQTSGTFNTILYDVLQGRFPGATTTTATTVQSGSPLVLADVSKFPPGTFFTMPLPPRQPLQGVGAVAQPGTIDPYYGYIQSRTLNTGQSQVITVPGIPSFATIPVGTVVTALARTIIRLANPPGQAQTGQLWYQYRPPRLVNLSEVIDPIIAEHQDMLLYYAFSQYFSAVNDNEASSWLQKAQLLKSELMQDVEPLSGQNSEALDSDLWGLG